MAKSYSSESVNSTCIYCAKVFVHKIYEKRKVCLKTCLLRNSKIFKREKRISVWDTLTYEQKIEKYKSLFEEKVIKQEGCWGWKSFIDSTGSGVLSSKKNRLSAYRASWIIHCGPIPEGLLVLHKCHNRICTNPEHLYLGTNKDNTRDMMLAGRGNFNQQNSKNAKLNKEKVTLIKSLISQGISLTKIARQFLVSRGTIQDIVRKKTWRNI